MEILSPGDLATEIDEQRNTIQSARLSKVLEDEFVVPFLVEKEGEPRNARERLTTAHQQRTGQSDEASCAVRHMFAGVYEATIEVMDRTNLQSVLDRSAAEETRGDESPTGPATWVGANI